MSDRMLIGIAVVQHDESVLVGRRDESQTLAGAAEFPGGKCQPGETASDCAVRECCEETGLTVLPAECLQIVEWSYPHGDVELHFWLCRLTPELAERPDPLPPFAWTAADRLQVAAFPAANASIIRRLIHDTQA